MKKLKYIICIILLLSVAVFAFAGCGGSTPTQRIIGGSVPWINNNDVTQEISNYVIYHTTKVGDNVEKTEIGKMVYTFRKINDVSTSTVIGGKTYNQVGYYVSYSNVGDHKDFKSIFAEALVSTNLRTIASYTKTTMADESWTAQEVVYDAKNCLVTTSSSNTETTETTIKIGKGYSSEPYYDNVLTYTVARSLPADVSSYSYKSVSFIENKTMTVSLSRASTTDILNDIPLFEGVTVNDVARYNFSIPNPIGNSAPYVCYVKSIVFDGKPLNNGILKIVEGDIEYVLSSFQTS